MRENKLPPPYDIIEDNEIDRMMHMADNCNQPLARDMRTLLWIGFLAFITAIMVLIMTSCAQAAESNVAPFIRSNIIDACIGEAEGETYLGKVMLMYTIFNRGTLKGVYGVNAPRVLKHQYAQVTYDQCAKAHDFARNVPNPGWKATGWGNERDMVQFRKHKWWKNCIILAHVGKHFFYMERKL